MMIDPLEPRRLLAVQLLTAEIAPAHGHHDYTVEQLVPRFHPALGTINSIEATIYMDSRQWWHVGGFGYSLHSRADLHLDVSGPGFAVHLDDLMLRDFTTSDDPLKPSDDIFEFGPQTVVGFAALPASAFAAITGEGTFTVTVHNYNTTWHDLMTGGNAQWDYALFTNIAERSIFAVDYSPVPEAALIGLCLVAALTRRGKAVK